MAQRCYIAICKQEVTHAADMDVAFARHNKKA
jgi:hypothetical protein